MFLRKSSNKKTGRTYISIVHGFWDKEKKCSRTTTVKSLGYLDELKKEFDDPIAHFEAQVAIMNEEAAKELVSESIVLDLSQTLDKNSSTRKNLGYAALSKIYHELEIDKFILNRSRHLSVEYSLNNIMKLLVFSRLLEPGSKLNTYNQKDKYFENTDFSLNDVYRALTHYNKHHTALQQFIYGSIQKTYGKNTSLVYYDVTNYYFEIDKPDEMRRKGVSKEHRPNPIIQMGLLMDSLGFPIAYKLFKGNDNDCTTLIPILTQVRRDMDLGRVIIVADRGINKAPNLYYNLKRGNGYVMSQTIRGGNKEFKKYALDEQGFTYYGEQYKRKSRLYPRELTVEENGKVIKVPIDEKQVIFYSEKYAMKAKADRQPALLKAQELVRNPEKFNKANSHGAAKYVQNLHYDTKTGEVLTTKGKPIFDEKKLLEEERYDGYYAIVSSELGSSDDEIIDIYRGLWRIEDAFRVTKSDMETRPVYLSREDHIQAHFLICYISLVIARILQHRVDNKYSVASIMDTLSKASCSHLQKNYYVFNHRDKVLDTIGERLGIDFSKKVMRYGDIKKILGSVKKGSVAQ